MAATAIGGVPRVFAYTALGEAAAERSLWPALLAVAGLIAMAGVGAVVMRRRSLRARASYLGSAAQGASPRGISSGSPGSPTRSS